MFKLLLFKSFSWNPILDDQKYLDLYLLVLNIVFKFYIIFKIYYINYLFFILILFVQVHYFYLRYVVLGITVQLVENFQKHAHLDFM